MAAKVLIDRPVGPLLGGKYAPPDLSAPPHTCPEWPEWLGNPPCAVRCSDLVPRFAVMLQDASACPEAPSRRFPVGELPGGLVTRLQQKQPYSPREVRVIYAAKCGMQQQGCQGAPSRSCNLTIAGSRRAGIQRLWPPLSTRDMCYSPRTPGSTTRDRRAGRAASCRGAAVFLQKIDCSDLPSSGPAATITRLQSVFDKHVEPWPRIFFSVHSLCNPEAPVRKGRHSQQVQKPAARSDSDKVRQSSLASARPLHASPWQRTCCDFLQCRALHASHFEYDQREGTSVRMKGCRDTWLCCPPCTATAYC